jgi:uncharacterized membrane protein YqjE
MMPQMERDRLQKVSERESIGEILKELAFQSEALVRDEVALAKQELSEKLKSLQAATITLIIGSLIGFLALAAACAAAIIGLAEYIEPWQSALIVTGILALAAIVMIFSGIRMLSKTSLKPEQTIQTLEEDKEWLKELT